MPIKKTQEERDRDIYTKAFADARADLDETNAHNTEERAKALADSMLMALLTPVDLRSVLTVNKVQKKLYIQGEIVDQATLANLKAEAEFIAQSSVWNLLYETPKKLAQDAMFRNSESLADMQKGKSILYALDSQKNILDTLLSFRRD